MEMLFSDINEAFPIMWHQMWDNQNVTFENSRNGPVRRAKYPVTTIFKHPERRVLLNKVRDCNPFFHLFESIWMLAGRNDVAWLCKFNKRMIDYSDDGITLVSSYGHRWSTVLDSVINRLRSDRATRRAYIPLFWAEDCSRNGKDIPCNTGIAFSIQEDALNMTVFNRSNDMIYGAYGANVVHFSFLQEYIAEAVVADLGYYAQISSNFHLYTEFDVTKKMIGKIQPAPDNPYEQAPTVSASPYCILDNYDSIGQWQGDAACFIDTFTMVPDPDMLYVNWNNRFFARIAVPMYRCWHAFVQQKDTLRAQQIAQSVDASDWRLAALQWIENRLEARHAKADAV